VQRWVAGGNASGGYSAQSDPLLGVVDGSGGPRLFTFEHDGRPHEIDLGPEPFVTLQWGAYFFVPSIAALKGLPGLVELPLPLPASTPLPERIPDLQDMAAMQLWLEDTTSRDAAWAWVRAQPGGVVDTAYGVLVGAAERVCEVLRNVPDRYSVSGYGERMHDSIGVGYLGLDDDTGHREQAPVVNRILESVSEADAFMAAYQVASFGIAALRKEAQALLAAFPASQKPAGLPTDTPLDLERLSEGVLAKLCQVWFGPPDGRHVWGTEFHPPTETEQPRCPAALFRVSRYVFGPHPTPSVCTAGQKAGRDFTEAVDRWLAETPFDQLPQLTQAILAAAQAVPGAPADLPTRMLSGVMLGFPPTTHANLVATLAIWVQTRKLWELQPQWHELPATANLSERYTAAVARLRPTLVATLNYKPTPFQVWRRARVDHRLGNVDVKAGDTLIVALGSATQQDLLRHHVVFGGDRADPQGAPPHACPGYGMGMGVMLGVIAAVMDAGVIRPTGAPTVLTMEVDPMNMTDWASSITAVAGLTKAWLDVRKSGLDLTKARQEMSKALPVEPVKSQDAARQETSDALPVKPVNSQEPIRGELVIDEKMLAAFVQEIDGARTRFIGSINDPRYSPADIDREEQRARLVVCAHLKRIREYNAGSFPTPELANVAKSYRCDS